MNPPRDSVSRMKFETICLHGGAFIDPVTLARAIPVYRTSSYLFKSTDHAVKLFELKEQGYVYSRINNPTVAVLERRLALLEGAPEEGGVAVASGTSAIFYSIVNLANAGDNIVSANNLYGGTHTQFLHILPQLGITVKMVDPSDPGNFARAIDNRTKAIFCETVSNPALQIIDLEKVAEIAHAHGLPLIVDATFSTPYLTRPLEFGADIVVHSLTKWLGGHGAAIGGIVIDGGRFNWTAGKHPMFTEPDESYHGLRWGYDLPEPLRKVPFVTRMRTVALRNLGACLSPDNAWIFLLGLETLPVRMERHCANARAVAEFLASHPKVRWVRYPGLKNDPMYELNLKYLQGKGGSMVVFGIKGGREAGAKFIDSLRLISHLANVGDAKTLAIHPATTTHSQLSDEQLQAAGVTPDMVRLSVGLEHIDDILEDIDKALSVA